MEFNFTFLWSLMNKTLQCKSQILKYVINFLKYFKINSFEHFFITVIKFPKLFEFVSQSSKKGISNYHKTLVKLDLLSVGDFISLLEKKLIIYYKI